MTSLYYKISTIVTTSLLLCNTILGQEINKQFIHEKTLEINQLSTIKQKQDSLENLSLKIVRSNRIDNSPLFEILDSLIIDKQLKLAFYFEWATSKSRYGDVKSSKKLREKALQMAIDTKEIAYEFEFTNSLASYFVSIAKADSVAHYNILADKLIKKYPEQLSPLQWQIHYRFANMHELLGNADEQKNELEKSWNEISKIKEHRSRGFLLYVLLDFYRQNNNEIKQAEFTELFLDYFKKKKLTTPDYHYPIETILLKDDSEKSLNNLIRINKLSDSLNNLNSLSQTSVTLGNRLIEIGRASEAIPYLKNSILKLNAANYPISNSGELALLQKAYQASGDYKNAYNVLSQQKEMEDSLRSSQMLKTIADYEIKYDTEKKDAALQKLSFEAEKAKQQERIYTVALLSGGLILAILGFFFYRNKKQNIKLAKQKVLLEATIDEKNVLLKETHHRVKNSFQIVSSLLYLQSENIKDKEAQAAMKEAQNRVRSMVLIHQRLYSKDQLVGISTDEYLKDLVQDIFDSHQAETKKISYTIDAKHIILGIETTTSLGLILNELITNVIKHAFPIKSEKGHMHISFKQENETLVLQVIDTGLGMPKNIKESSFGIELINALAKKLKAKLEFTENSPKGTIATLTIHRFVAL